MPNRCFSLLSVSRGSAFYAKPLALFLFVYILWSIQACPPLSPVDGAPAETLSADAEHLFRLGSTLIDNDHDVIASIKNESAPSETHESVSNTHPSVTGMDMLREVLNPSLFMRNGGEAEMELRSMEELPASCPILQSNETTPSDGVQSSPSSTKERVTRRQLQPKTKNQSHKERKKSAAAVIVESEPHVTYLPAGGVLERFADIPNSVPYNGVPPLTSSVHALVLKADEMTVKTEQKKEKRALRLQGLKENRGRNTNLRNLPGKSKALGRETEWSPKWEVGDRPSHEIKDTAGSVDELQLRETLGESHIVEDSRLEVTENRDLEKRS